MEPSSLRQESKHALPHQTPQQREANADEQDAFLLVLRNVYFIKENEDGVYVSGTIISDGTAWIVSMAEDENVSTAAGARRKYFFLHDMGFSI